MSNDGATAVAAIFWIIVIIGIIVLVIFSIDKNQKEQQQRSDQYHHDIETRPQSYVYVMHESNDLAICKIGKSDNPESRIGSLQSGNHRQLLLYKKFPAPSSNIAHNIESASHRKLQTKRIRGEWFRISPEEACKIIEANSSSVAKNYTRQEQIFG